jgi:putative ABC transport system permease protein
MNGRQSAVFIARMAWRDSRGQRHMLLLFALSVVFGIGALVAVRSLRDNLGQIIETQARSLLGADVTIRARRAPTPELEQLVGQLGGDQAREVRFRSMAAFPAAAASRFVQVRALTGDYPFYGEMETAPALDRATAGDDWVIVEESLMHQLGLQPGAEVRLGERDFRLAAALLRVAGEAEVGGIFAPRLYIPLESLDATGLVQTGSIVQWYIHLRFDGGLDPGRRALLAEARTQLLVDAAADFETVADRQRNVERLLGNLFDFLNLVSLIALLLGGMGVAGAVQVYVQGKVATVALLRCLGVRQRVAFAIYCVQVMAAGMAGALAGVAVGLAVQFALPTLLAPFLPFAVDTRISWAAIANGLVFGWLVTVLCSLWPLLRVRAISPLRAIRAGVEPVTGAWRDPAQWLVGGVLLVTAVGFAALQTSKVWQGPVFMVGMAAAAGVLALTAMGLRHLLVRVGRRRGPYWWRLGLSNLYRPQNRTLLLMVIFGMGVLLVHTLLLVRHALLAQVEVRPTDDAANLILLDVQTDQLEPLQSWLAERGVPVRDVLPVITMRVSHLRGESLRTLREAGNARISRWVYTWEFRNTYRDHVLDNATVVAGSFVPVWDGPEPYPISITQNIVDDLDNIAVGDRITWDVQGVPLETVVASIRDVRWRAGRQNFNVVFPLGTIEAAPTVYALTALVDGRQVSADVQHALGTRFSNVSLIDLSLVFETVNDIFRKVGFVVQFMAAFTLITGLVVMVGTVLTSRYQRIRESVLLRTVGAPASLTRRLLAVEFAVLGGLAATAGLGLSMAVGAALVHFAFRQPFAVDWSVVAVCWVGMVGLTVATGLAAGRGIANQPPLAVLRGES